MHGVGLCFGPFLLDRDNALLWRDDQRVPLPPKPFAILCHLAARPGALVSKDELLEAVWPGLHVSESSLTVAMNTLRSALGEDRAAPRYIETAPRRGYRFVASVSTRASAIPPAAAARRASSQTDPRRETRVGRIAALETIEAGWRRARDGQRQTLFLCGEPGIGKTTLIEMALDTVLSGEMGLMRCACNELFGAHEAFLPLIEGLSEFCRGPQAPAAIAALRAVAPTWMAQMPWLLAEEERSEVRREVFGANRDRMLREFVDLMERLAADRPLILIVEDLHWSDPATVDALSRLARGERHAQLLTLASVRPADATTSGHPAASAHRELLFRNLCVDIELEPLTAGEVKHHLALRFPSSAIAETLAGSLFARTHGQPLFLTSLVDHLIAQQAIRRTGDNWRLDIEPIRVSDSLPRDIREMVLASLARLGPEERALIEAASAAGPSFSALLLAGALQRDVLEVERQCETLTDVAKVLTRAGVAEWPGGAISGEYEFIHAIYREAAYQQLSPARKAHTHRRLGESLEAGLGARALGSAPVLALHFEAGRDFAKALQHLALAAESSAARFSPREAADYLGRALALTPLSAPALEAQVRPKLLLQRAWCWRASGDFAAAVADLAAMIEAARRSGDARSEVSGLVNLSRFQLYVDRRRCLPLALEAAECSRKAESAADRTLAEGNLASLRLMLLPWRAEDVAACLRAAAAIDDVQDLSARMRRHSMEMTVAILASDYSACREATRRGRDLARLAGDLYLYTIYAFTEFFACLYSGDWGEAHDLAQATLAVAEKNLNAHAIALCRIALAWLRVELRSYNGAAEWVEPSLTPAVESNLLEFFTGHIVLANVYAGLGDVNQALRHVEVMTRRDKAEGGAVERPLLPNYLLCRSNAFLRAGDFAKARFEAETLCEQASAAPDRQHLALAYEALARIALAEGRTEAAASAAAKAVAIVRRARLPLAAWRSYETAAQVFATRARAAAADAFHRRARRLAAQLAGSLHAA